MVPALLVEGATIAQASAETRESSRWGETLRDPLIAAIAAYGLLALLAAIAAYFSIFSQFAPYDDEGTLLVTLKSFVNGHVLYRDIYSEYGPFYYELFGGLFALTGKSVTTDAGRSIVIVIWVASSVMYGIAVQRLSSRLLLGLSATIAAFTVLYALTGGPMHPEGLCVLLLASFTLLAVCGPGRRVVWMGAAGGAVLAALVLTKVNLGAFAVAAVALAAVLTIEPLHRRRWLRLLIIAAFVVMPLVVTARDLSTGWVRDFTLMELLAMAALIAAAWPLAPRRGEQHGTPLRWLTGAIAGFAAAFVAIVVAILLTGPSPADVVDGVIVEAMRVRDVLVLPVPLPLAAIDWAFAAVAAAVVSAWWRLRTPSEGAPSFWPGALRLLVGLVIWCDVAHITPLSVGPGTGNPDTLPTLLAWVAVVPPAGTVEVPFKRFLRVLLPALAIAETLQVYPVAGAQMSIAALTFVPVGGLVLTDAVSSLRIWSAARGRIGLARFRIAVLAATAALVAMFAVRSVLRPIATNVKLYSEQTALPFPGATALRPPAAETEAYARVVDLIHRYRCTNFVGYPNIDSFYIWSGIEPPAPDAPGAWMKALDSEKQQRIVNEMRATPRPCAIRSEGRAGLWLHGEEPPRRPLVNYIFDEFKTVKTIGEFEFQLPKNGF